jgi:hypothetical protein
MKTTTLISWDENGEGKILHKRFAPLSELKAKFDEVRSSGKLPSGAACIELQVEGNRTKVFGLKNTLHAVKHAEKNRQSTPQPKQPMPPLKEDE